MTEDKNNKPIQSLWIGDEFSNIEKLSSSSYLKNNHKYDLYCYQDVKGVPEGVNIIDANQIIPESEIFTYKSGAGKGSFSAFSNMFRYKLIHDKGGYWSDTDVICLRGFDFNRDYVFGNEIASIQNGKAYGKTTASSFFYCKPHSEIMKSCFDVCMSKDKDKVVWGEIGPKLLGEKVKEYNLTDNIEEHYVFNPIPWSQIEVLFNENINFEEITDNCHCLHLWNEVWRRHGVDKNAVFNQNCIFEKLKSFYL